MAFRGPSVSVIVQTFRNRVFAAAAYGGRSASAASRAEHCSSSATKCNTLPRAPHAVHDLLNDLGEMRRISIIYEIPRGHAADSLSDAPAVAVVDYRHRAVIHGL